MATTVSDFGDQSQIETFDTAEGNTVASDASSISLSSTNAVFFAAFDGTGNNLAGTESGDPQTTNVAQLWNQYKQSFGPANPSQLAGIYEPGPGVPGQIPTSSFFGPTATAQAVSSAENAYGAFVAQATAWLQGGNGTARTVTVALTAFSRGDAAAAIFSQMLFERGLVVGTDVLIPPGQIAVSAGILFDPVTTSDSGNLAFAPNASNIVDIQAANEYRTPFEGVDFGSTPQIKVVQFTGNHVDIGGGYDNGIGALSLQAAVGFFTNAGINLAPTPSGPGGRQPQKNDVAVHREVLFKGTLPWPYYASFDPKLPLSSEPKRQLVPGPIPGTTTVVNGSTVEKLQLQNGNLVTVTTTASGEVTAETDSNIQEQPGAPITGQLQVFNHYLTINGSYVLADVVTGTTDKASSSDSLKAVVDVNSDDLTINIGSFATNSLTVVPHYSTVDLQSSMTAIDVLNPSTGAIKALTGATGQGAQLKWTATDGTQYQFSSYNLVGSPGIGSLTVNGGALGGDQLLINYFDLDQAETNPSGYLGIKFAEQAAIQSGTSPSSPFASSSTAPAAVDLATGSASAFTLYASAVSDVAQTFTLTLAGGSTSDYAVSTGSDLLAFANGTVTVTVAAGSDEATFALVNTADPGSSQTVQLSAALLAEDGTSIAAADPLTFDFTEPPPSNTQFSVLSGVPDHTIPSQTDYFDLSPASPTNWLVNTTAPTSNFVQVLGVGNDSIVGSVGNDSIGTGNGNSTVSGNGGQDELLVGNGNNAVYANSVSDLPTAIEQGQTGPSTGLQGSLLGSWNGNNTIVGGNGNDLILAGQGSNVIVAGPGNDTIWSGDGIYQASPTWTTQNTVNGNTTTIVVNGVDFLNTLYTTPADYEGPVTPGGLPSAGVGNSTIYGGRGSSYIFTSNGDNYVDAGGGNDTILGGMGSDTIFAGSGNVVVKGGGGDTYIDGESGNDFLVGQGGDNTIYGGTGNDTIYAGDDSLSAAAFGSTWDKAQTGDNYVDAGSGNSVIFGSGGNDTLIGGSGNVSISGGSGNEYIFGGSGNDSINGGDGNETIDAGGNGLDTIYAGNGAATIYGGNGDDSITGGSGSDVIYAGDGGDATQYTIVNAGSGDTTIFGGIGIDYIVGGSGSDEIHAGDGGTDALATQVIAGDGPTTVYGGSGVDHIFGGAGTDVLYAGDGGDATSWTQVTAGTGDTTVYGGAGVDYIYGGSGSNVLNVGDGGTADAFSQAVAGSGPTTIYGGAGVDRIYGGSGTNVLYAGDGGTSDATTQVTAGSGPTTIVAGAGYDLLVGGSGSTTYEVDAGNDNVSILNAGPGDVLRFGPGLTAADVEALPATVSHGESAVVFQTADGGSIVVQGGSLSTVSFADGTSTTVANMLQPYYTIGNTIYASVDQSILTEVTTNLTLVGDQDLSAGTNLAGTTLTANGGNDTLYAGGGCRHRVGRRGASRRSDRLLHPRQHPGNAH